MKCAGSFYDDHTVGLTSCTKTAGCGQDGCPDLQARQRRRDQELGQAIADTYHDRHPPKNSDITKYRIRLFQQAESLRASGHVARWHTLPHAGDRQTVAEHSGQAVSLLLLLHPGPSLSLIKALMWHDSAERIVGDVPSPVRRRYSEYGEMYEDIEAMVHDEHHPIVARSMTDLTKEERVWLKTIDVLELVMHCQDLVMIGNRHAERPRDLGRKWLRENTDTPQIVLDFLDHYFNQDGGPRSFA